MNAIALPTRIIGNLCLHDFHHGVPYKSVRTKGLFFSGSDKKREDDIEILKALYDGELNYLDHKIGELLQFLESLKIMDETFIVIAADHGDSLGEHTALGHRMTLYEPLVHVPMIIRYPSQFKPGTRISTQVQLSDLNPTFFTISSN